MKIVIDVPEGVTEEEIKELIRNYLKKKKKFEEFYELVKDVDWDELKKEAKNFREHLKFRESTC
jgi:Mn-dependent DtxR family transcriptional regulator